MRKSVFGACVTVSMIAGLAVGAMTASADELWRKLTYNQYYVNCYFAEHSYEKTEIIILKLGGFKFYGSYYI